MDVLRKIIEKSESEVHVDLPESLRGKRLEVIVLAVEKESGISGRRPLGLLRNKIQIPDSFFDPLPDDLLKGFGAL